MAEGKYAMWYLDSKHFVEFCRANCNDYLLLVALIKLRFANVGMETEEYTIWKSWCLGNA